MVRRIPLIPHNICIFSVGVSDITLLCYSEQICTGCGIEGQTSSDCSIHRTQLMWTVCKLWGIQGDPVAAVLHLRRRRKWNLQLPPIKWKRLTISEEESCDAPRHKSAELASLQSVPTPADEFHCEAEKARASYLNVVRANPQSFKSGVVRTLDHCL